MITENLSTLKLNKLTQAQYDRELAAGTLERNALYLTPDEDIDLSGYATTDQILYITNTYETKTNASAKLESAKQYTDSKTSQAVEGKADIVHSHAISDVTNLQSSLSSLQDLLTSRVPTSRTINGKSLGSNVTLSASDVGAYSKTQIDEMVLITIDDIDTICGASIQAANEVMF